MLPRRKTRGQPLTGLELEIMNVLWDIGPANVQSVQARIQGRELAYTTVQTMLNVLHRKGKVKRQLKERAYIYRPVYSRQKAVTQAVGEMLDRFFGGSADGLVLNLVETRHLTPERLAQIQKLIERPAAEKSEEPPSGEPPSEEPNGND
jgi:BlaI family penicillinase repressor